MYQLPSVVNFCVFVDVESWIELILSSTVVSCAGRLILSGVTCVLLAPLHGASQTVYEAVFVQLENFNYNGRGSDYVYLCLPPRSVHLEVLFASLNTVSHTLLILVNYNPLLILVNNNPFLIFVDNNLCLIVNCIVHS